MTNEGEATQAPTIGKRQTVDRAKHPTLGEGVAVYDNGPAFFRSDAGSVERYTRLGFGSCGVGGSWLRAITVGGAEVRLDVTGRVHGDRHWRIMTYGKARGWMVQVAKPVLHWRWEPDGGTPIAFEFDIMRAGTPGAMKRQVRRKNFREMPYEQYWSTFTARDGKHFVWCNESDADKVSWPKGKAES
mgnify:FL=1